MPRSRRKGKVIDLRQERPIFKLLYCPKGARKEILWVGKKGSRKNGYTEAWRALRRLVDKRQIPFETSQAALQSGEYAIDPPDPLPYVPQRSR